MSHSIPVDAIPSESIHDKRALRVEDEYLFADSVIDEVATKFI